MENTLQKIASWSKAHSYYGVYTVIALVIMAPLLSPGYILTLDLIFTPHLHMQDQMTSSYLLHAVFHILNFILPGDVIEKLVLLGAIFFAGVGAHRLMLSLSLAKLSAQASAFVAGIFYVVNPFTYDRFMVGQYNVLLGYALLPWFIYCFLKFLAQPHLKQTLRLCLWTVCISIVSIHTLGMLAILAVIGVMMQLWRIRVDRGAIKRLALYLAVWATLCVIASSYWLLPTLFGQGVIAQSVHSFDAQQRQTFATVSTNGTGTLLAVLGLQGFWGDTQGLYVLPVDAIEWWWLWQIMLLAVLAYGVVVSWRRDRVKAVYATLVSIVAVVLALGLWSDWLARWVPFFAGYREPQKFIALLALAYAYFLFWAGAGLMERFRSRLVRFIRYVPILLLSMLISLYTPTMFWGFYTQLTPVQYPTDWYTANNLLRRQSNLGKVLFLPWHLYMSFTFSGRIIANPAPDFFDVPVIVNNDPEFNNASPQFYDPLKYTIGHQLLPKAIKGGNITSQLRRMGIQYVLIAKELDYKQYEVIVKQSNAERLLDGPTISLYRLR